MLLQPGTLVKFKSLEQIQADTEIEFKIARYRGNTVKIPVGDSSEMVEFYNNPEKREQTYVISHLRTWDGDTTKGVRYYLAGEVYFFHPNVFEILPEGTPAPDWFVPIGSKVTVKNSRTIPTRYRGTTFTTSCISRDTERVGYTNRSAATSTYSISDSDTGEIITIPRIWLGECDVDFSLNEVEIDKTYTGPAIFLPLRRDCYRCGTSFIIEESETLLHEDEYLCPSCRERLYVTPYHRHQPKLNFWKMDGEENEKLFYGIELEVDEAGELDNNAAHIVKMMNPDTDKPTHPWFMYCSHDGSLNNGIEMITAPATIDYHRAMIPKYEELFKWLKRTGYRSHNTSTCGMHVHFSREYMKDDKGDDQKNICKLLWLVDRFWDNFVIFSRRDYSSLSRYAKKSDTNPMTFYNMWNRCGNHDAHYFALNISNPDTIEFRMFRGTLNLETFIATLEFVNSIVRLAKTKTVEELSKMQFEEILPPCARAYYDERVKQLKFCGLDD